MIPVTWYYVVAALLFAIGSYGAVVHKNAVRILVSLELMFNAELLLLLAVASTIEAVQGALLAILVIALTSSEIGVAIPIIVLLFRLTGTVDVTRASRLRG